METDIRTLAAGGVSLEHLLLSWYLESYHQWKVIFEHWWQAGKHGLGFGSEGCVALRIVLVTVPHVSRSCEHFPDGFDLHLLPSML